MYQKKPPFRGNRSKLHHSGFKSQAASQEFLLGGLIKPESPVAAFSIPRLPRGYQGVNIPKPEVAASYSWLEDGDPASATIVVPGSPAIWTFNPPIQVPADHGHHWIDENSGHLPKESPLSPIFAAIDTLHESYPYDSLDLVTDRNNLRKLIRWISGSNMGSNDFRINVEHYGNTLLFTRCEEHDKEVIEGFKGYGHEYEKAATRQAKGCERTTKHNRIIVIDLAGLKILLRSTAEACTGDTEVDDLADLLSGLNTESTAPSQLTPTTPPEHPFLQIQTTPQLKIVPQSTLIEIKTRGNNRPFEYEDQYPSLYLSQTPNLYIARHEKGTFVSLEKATLDKGTLAQHGENVKVDLQKLRILLGEIIEAVKEIGNGVPMSLVCRDGKCGLYKRDLSAKNLRLIRTEDAAKFQE